MLIPATACHREFRKIELEKRREFEGKERVEGRGEITNNPLLRESLKGFLVVFMWGKTMIVRVRITTIHPTV